MKFQKKKKPKKKPEQVVDREPLPQYKPEPVQTITEKEQFLNLMKRGVIYTGDDLGLQKMQVQYRKENNIPYGALLRAIEHQFPGSTKDWPCYPVPKELDGAR